jgi:hypothetical protein
MKTCTKCKIPKPIEEYSRLWSSSDGRQPRCKVCMAEYHKIWVSKNRDRFKDKVNEWHKTHRDRVRKSQKKWSDKNREHERQRLRIFAENNPEIVRAYYRKHQAKIRSTPKGTLNGRMSVSIGTALRKNKNGRKWESLVGYTLHDLMMHLEKDFCPGMSWENRERWHIDHIIPQSAFNYTTAEDIDFKRCWSLGNLRPMWASENLHKHAKLERPFQPSLSMSI